MNDLNSFLHTITYWKLLAILNMICIVVLLIVNQIKANKLKQQLKESNADNAVLYKANNNANMYVEKILNSYEDEDLIKDLSCIRAALYYERNEGENND